MKLLLLEDQAAERVEYRTLDSKAFELGRIVIGQSKKASHVIINQPDKYALTFFIILPAFFHPVLYTAFWYLHRQRILKNPENIEFG